ncbi:MAG TPA: 2-dehydropantoate 2-reductase [Thermomicrobiales bacterium]|nr:2-dehydropantoate 2-reductase [Thermomicrobiales bacterium]
MGMKVVIVGAGAMGGLFAARLARGDGEVDVAVLDAAPEVVAAINAQGLTLQDKDGTETARVPATTGPADLGPADLAIFFVKAQHTAAAAQLARPLVTPATTVVSLQNGWGNSDTLAATFPPEQLVMGVTYHSATVLGPGRVAHTGQGATVIGPYLDDAPLDRAEGVRDVLARGGLEATVTPRVKTEIWKKLILNAATLPTAALTRLCAGDLGQPGPMLDLVDALAAEAVAVARAQGYAIDRDERIARIHAVLAGAGRGKASMLQDVEARRKTEIEVINGAVVRAAERSSLDAPLNRAMVALIGGLERGWRQEHEGAGAGGARSR